MGRAARAEYKGKRTAERNYEMPMETYRKALGTRGQDSGFRENHKRSP